MNKMPYLSFPIEYDQYCTNASSAGEQPMSYALWLGRYKYVCLEDTRMLVARRKKQLYK